MPCKMKRKAATSLCYFLYLMKTKCLRLGNVEKQENGLCEDQKKVIL
jgi:hypothetical protein